MRICNNTDNVINVKQVGGKCVFQGVFRYILLVVITVAIVRVLFLCFVKGYVAVQFVFGFRFYEALNIIVDTKPAVACEI